MTLYCHSERNEVKRGNPPLCVIASSPLAATRQSTAFLFVHRHIQAPDPHVAPVVLLRMTKETGAASDDTLLSFRAKRSEAWESTALRHCEEPLAATRQSTAFLFVRGCRSLPAAISKQPIFMSDVRRILLRMMFIDCQYRITKTIIKQAAGQQCRLSLCAIKNSGILTGMPPILRLSAVRLRSSAHRPPHASARNSGRPCA